MPKSKGASHQDGGSPDHKDAYGRGNPSGAGLGSDPKRYGDKAFGFDR